MAVDENHIGVLRKAASQVGTIDEFALRTIGSSYALGGGVKYADIVITSSGDATIVAAVASKKIRVISMFITMDNDNDLAVKSGSTTKFTLPFVAFQGLVLPENSVGYFETAAGEALIFSPDTTANIGGSVAYVEV